MITGGTFTADKGQAPVKNADGNVLVAGGKFTASDCYALINMYDDETYEGGTVVITGGTFKAAGSEAAIVNEAELVITGGTFLLNGAKKDAVKCYKQDDSSLWYISDSLGLTPVVGG